jgi:hypothetical protein
LALTHSHDGEDTVSSVLDSCAIVLAIKSALLETLSLKATIEANGQPTSQVEELKKRHAVVTSLQERLQAAVDNE